MSGHKKVHPLGSGLAPEEALDFGGMTLPFFIGMLLGFSGIVYGFYFHKWGLLACIPFCYYYRMFIVTAILHRYFSHKTFKFTSPLWEAFAGFLTTLTWQRGPLGWGRQHRKHHQYSDKPGDIHSLKIAYEYGRNEMHWGKLRSAIHAFSWSHLLWIPSKIHTQYEPDPDALEFEKNPALYQIQHNRIMLVLGPLLEMCLYGLMALLVGRYMDGTWQLGIALEAMFVTYAGSIFLLWMGTFSINSLAHWMGERVYKKKTPWEWSANSFLLAIITLGEGLHANHHRFAGYCSQAVTRLQYHYDISFWGVCLLQKLGITCDIQVGVVDADAAWLKSTYLARDCKFHIVADADDPSEKLAA